VSVPVRFRMFDSLWAMSARWRRACLCTECEAKDSLASLVLTALLSMALLECRAAAGSDGVPVAGGGAGKSVVVGSFEKEEGLLTSLIWIHYIDKGIGLGVCHATTRRGQPAASARQAGASLLKTRPSCQLSGKLKIMMGA
jgi:hypothetical protein